MIQTSEESVLYKFGKERQLKACPRYSKQMYQVSVWSECQLVEMQAGEYRYTVDEDSIRSRLVAVHTYYVVRTSQAALEMFYADPPSVLAG